MLPDLLNMEADLEKSSSSGSKQQKQVMMAKVSISILVMSLPVLYVSFLHVPPATLFRDTTFWFLMSNSIIVVIAADSGMLFFGSSSSSSSSSSTAAFVDDRPFVVSGEQNILPMAIKNDQALVVTEEEFGALVPSSYSAVADIDAGEDAVVIKNVIDDGAMVQATSTLAAGKSVIRRQSRRSRSHSSKALVPAAVEDKNMVVVREEKLRRTATEGRRRQPAATAEEEESEYSRLSDEELNQRVEEFITRFNREIRLQIEKEQA